MRVTSKGQVTIPQPVRRALGIEPGSEVEITVAGERAEIRVVRSSEGERLVAHIAGTADSGAFTRTDQIMALTRGDD